MQHNGLWLYDSHLLFCRKSILNLLSKYSHLSLKLHSNKNREKKLNTKSSFTIKLHCLCSTVNIAMLNRVAKSDAHFKHQQRGEPDLTFDEKLQIATQVLEKNPATFLSRFGRYSQKIEGKYLYIQHI